MPNLFQKLKNNFSNSSSSSKSNNESNKKSNISVINVKNSTQDNDQTKTQSNLNQNKQINKSNLVLSLIIDNDEIKPNNKNNSKNLNEIFLNLFDPDEAPDEAETFNHITFIDDRSFIIDDDDLDLNDIEVAQIQKLNELAKENNCYTINELPETSSNKSRLSSSRASSRNSLGSESIRTNSSDPKSSSGGGGESRFKKQSSFESSGGGGDGGGDESGSNSTDALNKGSKNALLDALMQKFNVLDYEISDEITSSNQKNSRDTSSSSSTTFSKSSRFTNQEDQNRKKSELERKINNKINSEKNLKQLISHDSTDYKEASSSFDNDPKYIKLVRSTGTQMTLSPSLLKSTIQANRKKVKSIVVNSLPQVFECKYIGKTKCKGLWGLKNIREPVDRLIRNAKRKRSLNELPDIEALISEKGINIVQKPKTTDTASLISDNFKNLKSGLLPINNISYAVQDNIFGKVFSCIIVREKDNIVISECYSFLCAKNEIARKMALSITLAFKEYAKLIQIKESKINEKIKLMSNASSIQEPDSFA